MNSLISESHYLDCMIGVKTLPDQYIDIGWLDTQYGLKEDGRKSKSRCRNILQKNGSSMVVKNKHQDKNWDAIPMHAEYWLDIIRVCKNYIAFGVNYFQIQFPVKFDWGYKPPRRSEYDDFIRRNPTNFIIWDKVNGDNDFSDCELIYTTSPITSYVKYYMWSGMMQAACPINGLVQHGDKSKNQKKIHPTEKPIPLIRWLLQEYAQPGQILLDTHSGSQSARIACCQERINYIGYETELQYFNNGNYRYEDFARQTTLF